MKTQYLACLAPAAFALLVSAADTPALALGANEHFDCYTFPTTFFDQCTGEDIQGELQICMYEVVHMDANGGGHIDFQFRSELEATGLTTGRIYREHNAANQTVNFSGTTPRSEDSFTQEYHVNTSGPDNNLVLRQVEHVTYTPSGDITAFTLKELLFVCK